MEPPEQIFTYTQRMYRDYRASTCLAALSQVIAYYTVSVRQARGLPLASFRFRLTMDTLAFGYIFPATGQIPDFHRLETCAAGRTKKAITPLTPRDNG